MRTFTGEQYLWIDIANCYGLDKEPWDARLDWVSQRLSSLEQCDSEAESPILYRKAVRALREHQKGNPVNHIMGLDATASGIQLMAVMSGCVESAKATNLVYTGKREDVYQMVAAKMSQLSGQVIPRTVLKKPIMTFFYGSKAVPRQALQNEKLEKDFYQSLQTQLKGPFQLMELFQSHWRADQTHYQWFMPDKHTVRVPVLGHKDYRVELDEENHMRYTYRSTELVPKTKGMALAANITHSVDAYICRQVVRKAHKLGVQVAPIHDCFYAHPNHMNQVRQAYLESILELDKLRMVEGILKQISGRPFLSYNKIRSSIASYIEDAEYFLS